MFLRVKSETNIRVGPGPSETVVGVTPQAPTTVKTTGVTQEGGGYNWHQIEAWIRADRVLQPIAVPQLRWYTQIGMWNACGECSVAVMASGVRDDVINVQKLKASHDPTLRALTSTSDLRKLARSLGFELRTVHPKTPWDMQQPCICGVYYEFSNRHYKRYTGYHWLVYLGQDDAGNAICHDSLYHKEQDGAFVVYKRDEWERCFRTYERSGVRFCLEYGSASLIDSVLDRLRRREATSQEQVV